MESPWSTQTRAAVQNKALIFQAACNTTNVTNSKGGEEGTKTNLIVKLETVLYLQSFRDHIILECDAFVYRRLPQSGPLKISGCPLKCSDKQSKIFPVPSHSLKTF